MRDQQDAVGAESEESCLFMMFKYISCKGGHLYLFLWSRFLDIASVLVVDIVVRLWRSNVSTIVSLLMVDIVIRLWCSNISPIVSLVVVDIVVRLWWPNFSAIISRLVAYIGIC